MKPGRAPLVRRVRSAYRRTGLVMMSSVVLLTSAATPRGSSFVADLGDGRYQNPVLAGDYSDPDVVRVGHDYYLVASSITNVPALPILHSRDLVNWTLIGHALPKVLPHDRYRTPRRGGGVWAPAIIHTRGLFRIYYPDPDRGIFVVTAKNPKGPWSAPSLVDATRGAIDPAPFFDTDGTAWLAHAFAGSRADFSNVIVLKRMDREGLRTIDAGVRIVEGDRLLAVRTSIGMRPWQTTEGPKLYKRDGWYWLFVPSGSVKGGWQGVFRARKLAGPWEGRDALDQGPTGINGPHQGAWVSTPSGEDWFLHFQDTDSYGRRVFLEPMQWRNGWPMIGEDPDGDGIGQPVLQHTKPNSPVSSPTAPELDDEFDSGKPSLAWQWNANPGDDWVQRAPAGWVRLASASQPANLWEAGNLLSRKLPTARFTATTRLRFAPLRDGERTGLALFGSDYAWIGAERANGKVQVRYVVHVGADTAIGKQTIVAGPSIGTATDLWLRATLEPVTVSNPPPDFSPYWPSMLRSTHARTRFSYSLNGTDFVTLGRPFISKPGRWVGAQLGIFAQAPAGSLAYAATSVGYADFDWFRFSP